MSTVRPSASVDAVRHDDLLGADERRPPVHERRRHRRRALHDPLDAREVAVVDPGEVGDALQHRRRRR